CFGSGAEAGRHKRIHNYVVKYSFGDQEYTRIFGTWSSNEELRLLDAIEQYGVGNWYFLEDIADKVETRSPEECMEHYKFFYLGGNLGSEILADLNRSHRVTDHTSQNLSCLSPLQYRTATIAYLGAEEQQLLGYMPFRDDFERDYDNDAESLLCRINPICTDDDLESGMFNGIN
ncbi:unnamed protein product, partial [Protopolystoma xenopodis]